MTPKFHHLLHYPHAIQQLGPLKSYWCMRFEAKHRFSKIVGKNAFNFKNIAKTVSSRLSLNLAFSLGSIEDGGTDQVKIGRGVSIKIEEIKGNIDFSSLGFHSEDTVLCLDSVCIYGTTIAPHNYFIMGSSDLGTQFCQVDLCFFHQEKFYVVVAPVKYIEVLSFSSLFRVVSREKCVIIDPNFLDLEHPLVVANGGHDSDIICCPIECI